MPGTGARRAAQIFTVLTTAAVLFQVALAAGAPLGTYAWGGRYPGVLPAPMRVASVGSALVLALLIRVVRRRAGLGRAPHGAGSRRPGWFVVGFCALSVVANAATPSAGERLVWLPVTLALLATSLVVARSAPGRPASEAG